MNYNAGSGSNNNGYTIMNPFRKNFEVTEVLCRTVPDKVFRSGGILLLFCFIAAIACGVTAGSSFQPCGPMNHDGLCPADKRCIDGKCVPESHLLLCEDGTYSADGCDPLNGGEEGKVPELLDMLFVIDDSSSMGTKQVNFARSMPYLIELFEKNNLEREAHDLSLLDYRFGVASTSIYQRMIIHGELEHRDTYEPKHYNCLEGTAYDFEAGTPYPAGRLMAAGDNVNIISRSHYLDNPSDALRQLQENLMLGTCGSNQEQGLDSMYRVLINNPDFFRDSARLLVVFFTDKEDASDRTGQFVGYIVSGGSVIDTRIDPDYNYSLTSVEFYRDYIDSLAERKKGSIAIASIVSAKGRPPHEMYANDYLTDNCFDRVCAEECSEFTDADPANGPCWCSGRSPGARYLKLASMYSGESHTMHPVCQRDFSETMLHLVRVALAAK